MLAKYQGALEEQASGLQQMVLGLKHMTLWELKSLEAKLEEQVGWAALLKRIK